MDEGALRDVAEFLRSADEGTLRDPEDFPRIPADAEGLRQLEQFLRSEPIEQELSCLVGQAGVDSSSHNEQSSSGPRADSMFPITAAAGEFRYDQSMRSSPIQAGQYRMHDQDQQVQPDLAGHVQGRPQWEQGMGAAPAHRNPGALTGFTPEAASSSLMDSSSSELYTLIRDRLRRMNPLEKAQAKWRFREFSLSGDRSTRTIENDQKHTPDDFFIFPCTTIY